MNYKRNLKTYSRFALLALVCLLSFSNIYAQCIDNIILEPHACDNNNMFLLDLDFEYGGNVSDSFNIAGNGNNYGNFAYSDLFLTLGPFEGNGSIYEFVITDLNNADCTAWNILTAPDCSPPTDCSVTNLNVVALECNPDGTYSIEIDFDYENVNNSFFDVIDANGNNIGFYLLADLPVTIPNFTPEGGAFDYIQVCINDTPDCCAETEFNALVCPETCSLTNFAYEISPCTDLGSFFISISFNWEYTGTTFTVVGNGNNYGTFDYGLVPITLGPFPGGDGTNWEFGIFDTDSPDCGGFIEPGIIECPIGDCVISEVIVEAYDCNPNGLFLVDLDLQYQGVSDSFSVVGNGMNYGHFSYSDLYITLGPFEGNGSVYEFIVQDLDQPDCGGEGVLTSENCMGGACEIFDLVVEAGPCNNDGTYNLWINFEYQNPGNDFFDVFDANGNIVGTYSLANLPIEITYGPSTTLFDVIQICINDNPNCCESIEFATPNCNSNTCEIWDLIVEAHSCDDMGMFLVDIDFNYANTSDSFSVVGNGMNYGHFAYSDLYITLGPFEGNGSVYEFLIQDLDQPDCGAVGVLESENCIGGACEIFDLVVEAGPCNNDGTYNLWINFEYQNPGNDFFDVFDANGNIIETYSVANLPIEITYGPSTTLSDVIQICINDNPNCCESIEFETPNCNSNTCEIWDLIVEAHSCDDMGMFLVDIDFNYANTSDSFSVVGNGMNYGHFAYSDLYITLGPFEGNGSVYEFLIQDVNHPDCGAVGVLESENCIGGACEIFDLVVEAGPCNNDGTYSLWINFEYQNPGNDFFDVFDANGNNLGFYLLSDLPIEITYGPSNTLFDLVQICINDTPDCCEFIEFETPNCNSNTCEIWDLIVEAHSCDDMGMFLVDIDFNYANTSDSFSVVGNGMNYGHFAYSDLYVTLGPFEGNGSVYEFLIQDLDQPDCGAVGVLESEDCIGGTCEIWDLIVEAHDCDPGGNFQIDIDFNYQNTSDSFYVMGNGNNYGTFAYSDLYITIGPFPGDGTTNYNFLIMDQEQADCVAAFNLGLIECDANTDCSITNVEVYPLDCNPDGTYNLLLLFDYENVTTNGFDVYSGNTYVGYYDYNGNFPITINSFPASGNTFDLITICDSGGEVCCGAAEFEAPDCEECEITNLTVEALPCNDFNEFFVVLDFEIMGGGNLGFLVFGNGTNYGNFVYSDLPLTLGPFDGGGVTNYEFIVVDIVDNGCIGFVELGSVDCLVPAPIWPGDVNFDNTANSLDLLNLGIAYGFEGSTRSDTDIDWLAWDGDNWPLSFIDNVNYKHADCNGDGIVNNNDVLAIDQNYNETHGLVAPFEETPNTPDDPPLYIDLPVASDVSLGEVFVAPIILGTLETPVDEIYGLAFRIEFDPGMMDEAGVYVETNSSWLGEPGSELISINKNFPNDGIIDVAISRTNQTNVGGFGQISYFIGIIDDVAGKSELEINITNVRVITNEESWVPVYAPPSIIDLTSNVTAVSDLDIDVFPNPTIDAFFVRNLSTEDLQSISVYNTLGQLMTAKDEPTAFERIDVSQWAPGIYFVELQLDGKQITKKIKVTNL